MKVLICEQHNKPGGYCTSFRRGPFIFDAAAHSIGGYSRGHIKKIFQDLDLNIKLEKVDPSDIIILRDKRKISFWSSIEQTISDFQNLFPQESKNIKKFFYFISENDSKLLISMRNVTFKTFLDFYFTNFEIKNILSFPLLGNSSLPPSQLSAFMGIKIFQEFLLDGGYYMQEGYIQRFIDCLVEKFKSFGGELRLSTKVKKIKIINNTATGIILESNKNYLSSKYVISNCDARQTFLQLISPQFLPETFLIKLKKMIPSASGFMIYLGL
ncbi:MAG: FAD-dependent oxidoreductase, partial [Thermoplasmata archaeon]